EIVARVIAIDSGTPGSAATSTNLLSRQLFLAFKSGAMLVFIEAIAWFLLRQYRALVEDYKAFYKYYMRRANYLAALKVATDRNEKRLLEHVVETLLAEDLTGRLKRGETTETLEGQRAIDPNFAEKVTGMVAEVSQRAFGGAQAKGRKPAIAQGE